MVEDIEKNRKDAMNAEFKDNAEKVREWHYETGRKFPKEFDEDDPIYFGDFTKSLMIQTFEDSVRMPLNNPGFDWKCKSGDRIDNKGVFHINDKVRKRNFCEFDGVTITNDQEYLKEFEKYEFINRLEKLKELLSKRL